MLYYSRAFRPDGNYGIQVDIPGNMAAATFFTFYFMFILWVFYVVVTWMASFKTLRVHARA